MPLKGETLSEEAIHKVKIKLTKRMVEKYNWNLIEPYLDVVINIGSSNRKKKFITFRQFKNFIKEGKSLVSLRKITSKHLVQFYSNFVQGKIKLSKDDFALEYKNGLSLDEISKKYKVPREDITYLRQLYGINRKGAPYIKRKKTEVSLTKRQKEILYGSMMGDAKKAYSYYSSSVAFKHCKKQKKYLLWKFNEFKNVASKNSLKASLKIDKRSQTEITTWLFYTHANIDVENCIDEFYKDGNKEITKKILEELTSLSIAVWFQDDGMVDWGHRSIIKYNYNCSPVFIFCTDSFSLESCELIKEWFLKKYDIKTYLKEKELSDRIGYRIAVDINSIEKFINLIEPHILPMFKYKINYNQYKKHRKDKESRILDGRVLKCPLGADFSNLDMDKQDKYINDIVDFYQDKGIECLIKSRGDEWDKHIKSVLNSVSDNLIKDDYISFSNLGNNFLMSYFPNFWEARAKGNLSPKEIFNNKGFLYEIVRKVVIKGYFPSKKKILNSLNRYRGNKRVSGFMPCIAKAIYHKYCDEGDRIFDFCAGYGGRLFGAFACEKVKSYTCSEINFKTYYNLNNLYRDLMLYTNMKKEINIFNQDSVLAMKQFRDNNFDFCFTSPPYFNAEIYSDEVGQSCNEYVNYSDWFNEYLINSIKESMRISKKVAINIANTGSYMIADDLEKYLKKNNIIYEKDFIRYSKYGQGFKYESIFIIN